MNEAIIVTGYVVIDDVLKGLGQQSHVLAKMSDAEVLWVAIVAALYFQNHHERALFVLCKMGYLGRGLSISRFNRRLHQLARWLPGILAILSSLFQADEVFVVDSLPVPVCKRVRAGVLWLALASDLHPSGDAYRL